MWEITFVVLKIAGILFAVYYARKRVKAWKQKTAELGFQFSDKADKAFVADLAAFKLFKNAKPKYITNLMRASAREVQVSIFDYRNPSSGIRSTIICFRSPLLVLPRFSLRPEHFWHKLFGLFGYQDIDFESHPRFSRMYLLRGPHEEAVRGVFFEDVLDHFEQHSGLQVTGGDDKLFVFRPAKQVEPEKLRAFLQDGFRIYDLFKTVPEAAESDVDFELDLDDEIEALADKLGV